MREKKQIEPIPEEFESYEAAAEFWETHDTSDYPAAFRTVEVQSELKNRRIEIEIDADVVPVLRAHARRKGITPGHLASDILRQRLATHK